MESEVAQKISLFFGQYPLRRYKKGQILIDAGEESRYIFHLVAGTVKQYDISLRGDEVVLNVFKPTAFFPMSHAINRTRNDYFFEAETDVELHKAPLEDVVTFVRANPEVVYDLLSRVYRGTDGLLKRLAYLMAGTAKSRIMHELIIECRRFGAEKDGGYAIPFNETDIAARTGLTRETVSRELHGLKADALVKVVRKQIVIPNLEKLEESLGRDL